MEVEEHRKKNSSYAVDYVDAKGESDLSLGNIYR